MVHKPLRVLSAIAFVSDLAAVSAAYLLAYLLRFRFEIVPAFCHSQGRICQGGFLTGMVDTAMANAAIAKGRLAVAVPTLELKISFFEAMGPGIVIAEGRVMRWGGSVGFLDGDIRDEKGRLIVHATLTIKIVRPKTKL